MKNIYKYALLVLMVIVVSLNVKADNLSYYLSNKNLNYEFFEKNNQRETKVKRGDYLYVMALINNEDAINYTLKNGSVTIRYDNSVLKLVAYDDGNFYRLIDNNLSISVGTKNETSNRLTINYTANGDLKAGKNQLMEFKFVVLDNANVGVTRIYELDGETSFTYSVNEESKKVDSLNTELKYNVQKNDISTLLNIKIDGSELEFFNENTLQYDINVEQNQEKINIEATKKDSKATISGDLGTKNLVYGLNTFNINVTSEAGTKKTYVLKIMREDNRSSVNTLKFLKLSSGIINFREEINDYNVIVLNEVDKLTITSSLTDEKSHYEEDYTNKEINLLEGINKVQIKVIAENGSVNVYTINITRELSGNNTLKEISVNGNNLELKENDFYYYYEVENDVTEVSVKARATNDKAKVEISKVDELEIGDNEIGITVTAPNGNAVSYNLNVHRKSLLSNNAKIKDLTIEGYELEFDSEVYYYTLNAKDDIHLNLKVTLEDEKASFNVEGNRNLANGSIIKIIVTAEDGTVARYFITIEKKAAVNMLLIISLIIIIVAMVGIIVLVYMKANDKKKKQEDDSIEKEPVVVKNSDEVKEEAVSLKNNLDEDKEKIVHSESLKEQEDLSGFSKKNVTIEEEAPVEESISFTKENDDENENNEYRKYEVNDYEDIKHIFEETKNDDEKKNF